MQPIRPNIESYENVSDDEASSASVSDYSCGIFKPQIDKMKFASIENGDIVELSHVDNNDDDINLFIRSVKHDQKFEKLMVNISKNIESRPKMMELFAFKQGDVGLVEYAEDYNRAVVINDNSFAVQLIDIGVKKNIDQFHMRYISPELFDFERMVTVIRLLLPRNLLRSESAAVKLFLNKLKFNRFKVKYTQQFIQPNSVVDLVDLIDGTSLTKKCLDGYIEDRFFVERIQKQQTNAHNVTLYIIENKFLSKGFITCILREDIDLFAKRFKDLCDFGQIIMLHAPYTPRLLELCIVFHPDEDETPCWYRAQFQQLLSNNQGQVGLFDFGIQLTVPMSKIRKFDAQFAYHCISMTCKLRNKNISIDLLNRTLFENHMDFDATSIISVGEHHEVFVHDQYFFQDDCFI